MKIRVPLYAKQAAREGLKSDAGLTLSEAKKQGISSGRQTARTLIEKDNISVDKAKQIGRFYDRFKGCQTKRCDDAIDLWGGRKFGRKMAKKF